MQNKQSVLPPLTEYMYAKASRQKIPLSGTFELSPVCNFSCRMCYVRKTAQEVKNSPRPIMKKEQWLEIAEQAKNAGMLYVLLTGGEPLLWPDFWELYEALVKMGLLVSINTNGSMIDQEAVERFQRYPPKQINITLYGASDATYERLCQAKNVFARVDWAINHLVQAHIRVKLNCSLTPHNVKDLEAIVTYAKERTLTLIVASYMFPPIRRDLSLVGQNDRFTPQEAAAYRLLAYRLQQGEADYRKFLEAIVQGAVWPLGLDEYCVDPVDGRIRCRAGNASYWITWDGWMNACGMMPEPGVDMTEKSFGEAWSMLVRKCENLAVSGTCTQCPNHDLCGSCPAMAIAETGKPSGIPRYMCETVVEMKRIAAETLEQS